MSQPEVVIVPVDGLVVEAFDDAVVIWHEARGRLHHLDRAAATVWAELDGRTIAQVAEDLAPRFEAGASLLADLITLCDTLLAEGLVRPQVA